MERTHKTLELDQDEVILGVFQCFKSKLLILNYLSIMDHNRVMETVKLNLLALGADGEAMYLAWASGSMATRKRLYNAQYD